MSTDGGPRAERDPDAGPHGVRRWLPAAVPGLDGARTLELAPGASRTDARAHVRATLDALPAGQALVVHDPAHGRRPGTRGPLAGLGQDEADLHAERLLVLPGTGGSHVLLGAAPRPALVRALDLLPQGRARWRALRRVLGPVARLGGLERAGLPELWVLHRGDGPRAPRHLSVVRGVDGWTRKSVLRLADAAGRVERFVKVAEGEGAAPALRREAATLELLAARAPHLAPRALGLHDDAHGTWLAQAPLDGSRAPDVPGEPLRAFLTDLRDATARPATWAALDVRRRASDGLRRLEGRVDAEWHGTFRALERALAVDLEHPLPCGLGHGDLTPWNARVEGGRLRAFDWEFAEDRVPPLFDLAHFVLQTGVLVRHRGAEALRREFVALARGPFADLAAGADPHALLGAQLLHQAVHDERVNALRRPAFAQVDWLRRARLDLARLLLERRAARGARADVPNAPDTRRTRPPEVAA